jgi:cytoskeletal protein RodZ
MGGSRPDRTKTTPQTGGEASAAYHAEHSLRAGHSAHDEEMKVLVDTVRLPAAAESSELSLRCASEPTHVMQSRLGPRIVVAALAGLLVVAAIFTFFSWGPGPKSELSSSGAGPKSGLSSSGAGPKSGLSSSGQQAPAAEETLTRAAVAAPDLPKPAVIPAAAEPAAAPQPVAEAPAAPAAVEAPPPSLAPAPAAVASRSKSTGHVRKSPSDVGEFKTTF